MARLTGRCLCGAVRWETDGPVLWAGHCHCDSCRRATSAPFTTFFGVPRDGVVWTGQLADHVTSGGSVRRQFCPDCGSQLTYQSTRWPEETHLYAASLDDPSQITPAAHFHFEEKLPWLAITDDLPKYAATADGAVPIQDQ
ncbi:GFA family protein [Loktanella sp. IMCC34160]|uniref:GFA family protein n=1 Tax=Loktanella sp. IMCC34160 TaxID=2510646 RepID=UPI0013ED074F|nr:GFA family protein [Loktanella sp. IMCC34160]